MKESALAHRKLGGPLVAATHNTGKLREFGELLGALENRARRAPPTSACPNRRRPATASTPMRG